MKIQRTLSPTAAPFSFSDLASGLAEPFQNRAPLAELTKDVAAYFGVKHAFFLALVFVQE